MSEICPGLRPPPIVQLVPDSDEDYDGSESYLSSCSCGHDVIDHGADLSVISRNEFERRGRVAGSESRRVDHGGAEGDGSERCRGRTVSEGLVAVEVVGNEVV